MNPKPSKADHTLCRKKTCSGTLLLARISSAQISSTAHHTPSCNLFLWLLAITLGEFSWILPVSPQHSRFPTQYSIYLPPHLGVRFTRNSTRSVFPSFFLLVSQSLHLYQRFHVFLNYDFCNLECRKTPSLSGASTSSRRTRVSIFVVVTVLVILIATIFVCSIPFALVIPLAALVLGSPAFLKSAGGLHSQQRSHSLSFRMSRHCSSYGGYLSSWRLSRTHCVKTPSTTASVDCDQASKIAGSVFLIFCGSLSYNTTVKFSH